MLKRSVGHQRRRATGRAASNFLSTEIARRANILSRNERLQRPVDGAGENFRRIPAHDALDDAVDRRAVVEIAAHEGRVDCLGRHENHFQVDSLLTVKSFVIGDVKRQKADVGGLDPHPDSFESLPMQFRIRKHDQENDYSEDAKQRGFIIRVLLARRAHRYLVYCRECLAALDIPSKFPASDARSPCADYIGSLRP